MISFEKHRSDKREYLYHQYDTNLNFPKHTHRSFEILFVLEGGMCCEIDGQMFALETGECIMILPGQIHSYETPDYCKSYLCVFSGDWIPEFYETVNGNHFERPVFALETPKALTVLQNKNSDKFRIRSVLYSFCSLVFTGSRLLKTDTTGSSLVNTLAFLVQDNYRKPLNLKEIAKKIGYNYSYLSSFFHKHFQMNFTDYVNHYRIQLAREYLSETDKNITEIADLCGFDTIRNFNRIFKKECEMTPGEYRRLNRNS